MSEVNKLKRWQKAMSSRLKMAREINGMSQGALAKQVGLSQSQISLVESGESVFSMSSFLLVCITLKVNPGTLLDLEDE